MECIGQPAYYEYQQTFCPFGRFQRKALMPSARKVMYVLLSIITVMIMLASVLSVFRNTPSNYLKMLDFPRLQFFIASLLTLPLFVLLTQRWRWYDYALVVGLLGGMVINGFYLVHYTPLYPERVPAAAVDHASNDQVSLYLANVLMDNREAKPLLDQIDQKDADFVVLMEVDNWWLEQLASVREAYPYHQERPNEVAYGMALYSKFPLENLKINDLNNEKVPSFETTVTLNNGREILLHTVHPVPPTDFKRFPDNQGQQEVALLRIGEKVQSSALPNLVVGDLNDVVWGFTDLLTGTDNLLYDVRVGRGSYHSFNADRWYMRWPLDHVFVTKEFSLNALERMDYIGSDHFPIYVELVLEE